MLIREYAGIFRQCMEDRRRCWSTSGSSRRPRVQLTHETADRCQPLARLSVRAHRRAAGGATDDQWLSNVSLYGTGTRAVDCSTFCAWMLMHTCRQLQDREAYEALQIWDATQAIQQCRSVHLARHRQQRRHSSERVLASGADMVRKRAGKSQGHSRLAYCNGSALANCLESTISDRADGPQWREVQWSDLLSRHAVRLARLY